MEFERVQILLENQWADMAGSGGQWDYQDVTVSLGDDGAVIVRTDGTLLRKLLVRPGSGVMRIWNGDPLTAQSICPGISLPGMVP